ncbi:MAG: hypothetical protein RLZZ244_864 [Verrucomicrobiota bacterium]
MLKDVEFEGLVVAGVAALVEEGVVEGADFIDEVEEEFAAGDEVVEGRAAALGAHDLYIEADELAGTSVAILLQHADLVECGAEVGRAEILVLVVLESVLVVEMDAAQFLMGEREGHFVTGIESGEEGVGAFDEAFDAGVVFGCVGEGDGVADGGNVGEVGGFVGFGFDPDFDGGIVVEDAVDGFEDAFVGEAGVLGLAEVGAFAAEPEDERFAVEGFGDVDGFLGALPGVGAVPGVVGGVGAVDGVFGEPEARGDELGGQAGVGEGGAQCPGALLDLRGAQGVEPGDGVIVVELDPLEAELAEEGEFFGLGEGLADFGAEGVGAFADVPRAEGETIVGGACSHGRKLLRGGAGALRAGCR